PLNTAGAAGRGPAVDGGGGRGDNGSAAPPRRGAGTAFYPWGKLFDGPVPAEPARRPGVAARRPPAGVPAAGVPAAGVPAGRPPPAGVRPVPAAGLRLRPPVAGPDAAAGPVRRRGRQA